ncbi:MAG: NADH-quinone oxidoreductase subunit F, partial [Planctomycetota bacterium]
MPTSPDFKPTPVLTKRIPEDRAQRKTVWFDQYVATGGYKTLEKVLSMQPGEITDQVKAAILRGRGGAGFPAGLKWSFLSPPDGGPRYLAINCDEAEPGTFKDRLLVDFDPHAVLEGIAIAAYACQMQTAYFFIRGEYHHQAKVFQKALEEAYANGVFG